jgi:hypothetical protein
MSRIRPEGGLSGTYRTPTVASASGVWSLRDLERNLRTNTWPSDYGDGVDDYFKLNGFLIHADGANNDTNNLIYDNSTDKVPFSGTNSVFFNGSTDYLTLPNTVTVGSDVYTLEGWFYASVVSSAEIPIVKLHNSTQTIDIRIVSSKLQGRINTSSTIVGGDTTINANQWYHFALVKESGGTAKLYINGVAESTTATDSTTYGSFTTPRVGANQVPSLYFGGWISNVRLLRGTALYTTNFTPPTSALTAITNTTFLVCQSSSATTDNSANAYTITQNGTPTPTSGAISLTRSGNPGQGTFSPFSEPAGYWSTYLNGSSILSFAANSNYLIGTQNFTVECWAFINSTGSIQGLVTSHQTGGMFQFYVTAGRNVFAAVNVDGGATSGYTNLTSSGTITNGTWNHLALVRNGTEVAIYINGVKDSNTVTLSAGTNIGSYGGNKAIYIGSSADQGNKLLGHISNVRYVVGNAVYTSNFTPPTSPLTAVSGTQILTCQDNRFKDNSTNAYTVAFVSAPAISPFSPFTPTSKYNPTNNGGSLFFNGTTDYARVPVAVTNFGLGTGDWTVEYWVYFNSVSAGCGVVDFRTSGGGASQTKVTTYLSAASTFSFYAGGAVRISHTVIPNQWYHVAVVRSSGLTKFYLNGASAAATYTDTIDYTSSAQMTIGCYGDSLGSGFFPGYVSDVRVTKSAVYTNNFTPPTQPLETSTSSFLLKTTNGKVIDQTGNMSIATVSTAKLSTTQSKFGGTGITFNGSSDYLALSAFNNVQANIPALHLGASNFTIEGWVYPTSFAATKTIFFINGLGTAFAGLRLDITTSGTLQLLVSVSGSAWAINYTAPSPALTSNAWNHVAIVRSGSNFYIFINGSQAGATQTNSSGLYAGNGFNLIGAILNTTYQQFFVGYMDELRFTRYARYTTNFTPQTAPYKDR